MAHKVILPPKKNYIPQFLKQRDINSYYVTDGNIMYLTDASRSLISCVIQHYAPVVGWGGGRKSPSNKLPPPPSSIPPHIQLIGRNNKQQHTRTPNNRQQHTTTVHNSTLVHKNTNVPLFKKLFDIIFFGGENHFMSHFSGHFEGASTFLTPKLSLAALGTI